MFRTRRLPALLSVSLPCGPWSAVLPAILLAVLLAVFCVPAVRAADPGRLGLSLKAGEAGGVFGTQLAYNFDANWQATLGVGGAGIPYLIEFGNARTDSYALLGKYYLKHVYLATGYSLKRTRVVVVSGGETHRGDLTAHGLPVYLGYEFGNRRGFFFSTSVGLVYVFKNGDRRVMGPEDAAWSDARTVKSGPSLGLTLGYYFDLFRP